MPLVFSTHPRDVQHEFRSLWAVVDALRGELDRRTRESMESISTLLAAPSGGGGSALPVVDTTALVKGSADATKLARLEVDGLTTGVTRVLTVPDADLTLVGASLAQLLSLKTLLEPIVSGHEEFSSAATPANPAAGAMRLFTRINGANIELISIGPTGDESVLCVLVNADLPMELQLDGVE